MIQLPNSFASRIRYPKHFHCELSRNVSAHRSRRIASYFVIGADYLCARWLTRRYNPYARVYLSFSWLRNAQHISISRQYSVTIFFENVQTTLLSPHSHRFNFCFRLRTFLFSRPASSRISSHRVFPPKAIGIKIYIFFCFYYRECI